MLAYMLRSGPLPWLLAVAAAALVATALLHEPSRLPDLCGAFDPAALAGAATLLVHVWTPGDIVLAWLLMLAAMMPPLLAQPVGHVWLSSFRTRRARSVGLFALGYAAVWLGAGAVLVPLAVLLRIGASEATAGSACIALAFAWSSSPAAQVARNRCHRVRRISASGTAADRDCLAQGVTSGVACAAACWPWMLTPMAVGGLHLPVMAAITLLLFLERLAPPRCPVWQPPPSLGMLAALVRAQNVVGTP